MTKIKLNESIRIDLDSDRDTKEQILEILEKHPNWYLTTYFHRKWYSNYHQSMTDSSHIVAEFNTRENCVPIDRNDGIRWGLTRI